MNSMKQFFSVGIGYVKEMVRGEDWVTSLLANENETDEIEVTVVIAVDRSSKVVPESAITLFPRS